MVITTRAIPFPNRKIFYFLIDITTYVAGLRTCIESIYLDNLLSIPICFIFKLSFEPLMAKATRVVGALVY